MSGSSRTLQPTTPPSSSSLPATIPPSTQSCAHDRNTLAVATLSNDSLYDTDDDLSDAPESPVLPTSPTSSNNPSTSPPSDTDSSLSSAPTSPIWPVSPKPPATPPHCTEKDCPVKKAIGRHHQGRYLHGGKPPLTNETIFGDSNPPANVWRSWKKIQARDRGSTVEDDWNVFGFLRWHVEDPNTSLMGI